LNKTGRRLIPKVPDTWPAAITAVPGSGSSELSGDFREVTGAAVGFDHGTLLILAPLVESLSTRPDLCCNLGFNNARSASFLSNFRLAVITLKLRQSRSQYIFD
jgi:hypothetical protein